MAKKASDKKGTDDKKGKAKTVDDSEDKQTKVIGLAVAVPGVPSN